MDRPSLFDNANNVPYTSSEEFRHRCEVRWLIAERVRLGRDGKQWLLGYLQKVGPRRMMLERDIIDQWKAGNRGEPNLWVAV